MNQNGIHETIGAASRLRPTLIIGAGGTGYETVVRVKARFQESFPPELLQQIRYVVFDTDTNHPPVRNSLGEMVYLEPGLELFQIGGVPVKGIIDNQSNYPEIAQELELKKLPRLDLTKGAKQVRQLGRLAFFYHFQRIRKVIENALRDVLNISHSQRGSSEVQAINAFFITSACGGTGSGVMLDIAYLTRHLAKKWGIPVDFISSTGVIVLPEAFTKVPASNEAQIRANASAMLAEIDHFMTYGDFDAAYPDKTHVVDSRPPFSLTYLVGASNERNQTVEDLNQLTPVLAEALFLQAGSYLGASVDSVFDNIPTSTSEDINGYLRSYSMVGASTLRFNAQRVRNACAYRLVREIVDIFLDTHRAPRNTQDAVEAFMGAANLTSEVLKQQMRSMSGQEQMVVNLNTEMFDRVAPAAIVRRVENAVQRFAQETVSERYLTQMERNRTEIGERAGELLTEYVENLVDRLDGGIPLAQGFLNGVIAELEPLRNALQREREDAKTVLARSQREIERAHEAFEVGAQSFSFWGLRKSPLQQARRRYTETNRRYQQQILEQSLANQGLALLEAVELKAQRLLGRLSALKAALEQAANDAARDGDVLKANWRPMHVTEEVIDSPENVDVFYQRYLNESVGNEARELVSGKSLSAWLPHGEGSAVSAIGDWMRVHALERFERIVLDESVEKQIQDQYGSERDRRGRLQTLIGKGSPFCNYETTYAGQGSDDLDQILVVGVQDKNASIFSDVQLPRASLVSTFDKDRISVLFTKHGLPVYGLRQYSEYKRHFAALSSGGRALPMFGFKKVAQEQIMRDWFAQGEAFGVIGKAGARGYVLANSEQEGVNSLSQNGNMNDANNANGANKESKIQNLKSKIELGLTLREAIETLVKREELHEVLREGIENWLRGHTHEEAMVALEGYMAWERRNPMPLHDELVLLARTAFERHRRLAQA